MTTQVTFSAPSASAAIRATSAESIPPETRDQDVAEAVLGDVVAQPDAKSLVDLGQIVHRSAQPGRRGAGRSQISSSSRKRGRPRQRVALGVDDEAVAVEDQLVLASDQVAEGERGPVGLGALGDHLLALGRLAAGVGRARGVEDQLARRTPPRPRPAGPAPRCPRRSSGRPGRRSTSIVIGRASRLEVAPLVEDRVVGQVDLPVDGVDGAVAHHGQRVRGGPPVGRVRAPDHARCEEARRSRSRR